ncbi:hypothetical protein [Rhodopirellula sallentina]|uniref:Uncharacterized protein n=1 Tax=Rhodopirellula sallentina SM41 TaxID=1263870 RepID=M5U7J9_9BACT|nr:hypothetical protein [Rhodopirellula sallentina]EMI57452.1 hypothetical protein RSSM_01112 [Rhodopirellula sallentina SM41]
MEERATMPANDSLFLTGYHRVGVTPYAVHFNQRVFETPTMNHLPTTEAIRFRLFAGSIVAMGWVMTGETIWGQTVQLPSIRQFSYQGRVLVPDRGTTYLGGNRSYATSSSSRGIPMLPNPPGSTLGSQASAGGVSASVTIIDLDEMDRQILGYDPREKRRSRGRSPEQPRSVSDEIAEAKSLVRNARLALSKGQRSTAKAVYELAIEKLSRLTTSHRPTPLDDSVNRNQQPAYLLAYAKAEFSQAFPDSHAAIRNDRFIQRTSH